LQTFSPELKLHLARVVTLVDDGLKMKNIKRPVIEEEPWDEERIGGEGEGEGADEEWVLNREDIGQSGGKWKVLPA
jgi:hypothetical protein